MILFPKGIEPQEARVLTSQCLQAIAAGFPVVYFKAATIQRAGQPPQGEFDLNAMVEGAADLAAALCVSTNRRFNAAIPEDPCSIS